MHNYEHITRVKDRIEERRLRAIAEADARGEEIRTLSEKIRNIDKELRTTGLQLFKAACAGEDITPIKERNQLLLSEKRAELKRLGYPEDYTEVHYFCPDCSDTGFIDGTGICHCYREELIRERIAASGMGKLLERQSFDNFDLKFYSYDSDVYAKMKANLAAAKSYVANFKNRRDNLLLIGKTGTGKTHISSAIAREIINLGYDVVYDSTQNIISDFEADKWKSGYGDEVRSDKYVECDLLIIDDLGTEFSSQFTVSCLYNLLNTRQNRGLATIISTNLSAGELAKKYEDRIYSRIIGAGCRVLVFEGMDRRISG